MTTPAPRTIRWTPHYRVTWGGTIGDPPLEIWSNTLRFRGDQDVFGQGAPVLDHDQLQTVSDALAGVMSLWMNDSSALIGQVAKLHWVKVNWVNNLGLQPDQNTIQTDVPAAPGGLGAATVPWLLTYALTLRTALHRGRAHAGRIYPPVVGPPLTGTGPYITTVAATGMATAFARTIFAMEAAFNDAASINDPNIHAIVASAGDTAKAVEPTFQRITGVVCDRVADVMHSRNRQIARSEGALVAPGP
jgi:hypothetical protein